MSDRDKLRIALQDSIEAVSTINAEIQKLDQQIQATQAQRNARQTALAQAIGAREALAPLFLPEGKDLPDAWTEDLDGLRTGARV